MHPTHPDQGLPRPAIARLAGALYLLIAVCGIWSEFLVRAAHLVPGDAVATAGAILSNEAAFRGSVVADTVAATADAALVGLFVLLFRSAGLGLILGASVFRLLHAALMAGGLMFQMGAVLYLGHTGIAGADWALVLTQMHAHTYDLALVFFGIHLVFMGGVVARIGWVPRLFAPALAAGGAVYVAGALIRFLAPDLLAAFQPAYAVPALAEIGFALWLVAAAPGRIGRAPG